MRTSSAVIHNSDFVFAFGRGYVVRESPADRAVIVSAGRGVHEALAAAAACEAAGVPVGVVDMPSIDEALLLKLCASGKLICLAEQNNGFILQNLQKLASRWQSERTASPRERSGDQGVPASERVGGSARAKPPGQIFDWRRVLAINTLDPDGRPRFIHSGTYEELTQAFGLSSAQLARTIRTRLETTP